MCLNSLTRAAGNVPNAFQMTFGKSHGVAIDASERVHAWGRGDVGQTGLGHCDDVGLNDEAKPWPLKIKDPITVCVLLLPLCFEPESTMSDPPLIPPI